MLSFYSFQTKDMKKLFKLAPLAILAGVFFFAWGQTQAACLGTGSSCFETTQVDITILPGDICIGNTGSFDFGNYTVTASSQTITGAFTDYFWVDDLKWSDTGYYTTLQLSGDLDGPGTATIPASSVSVKVDSTASVTLSGTANANVDLPVGLLSYTPLDSAVTFLRRLTGANDGVVGKYGKYPELQIVVAAYQAVGDYVGTLVYTLYEN